MGYPYTPDYTGEWELVGLTRSRPSRHSESSLGVPLITTDAIFYWQIAQGVEASYS